MQKSSEEIIAFISSLVHKKENKDFILKETVGLLKENFEKYTWVGIYLMEKEDELVLGHYLGKPSPHTRIKIDKGICGAAVRERETIIVPEVNEDPRYLACSLETKSEIVVPIMRGEKVFGDIDIDSDRSNAFDQKDKEFLEKVAEALAGIFE